MRRGCVRGWTLALLLVACGRKDPSIGPPSPAASEPAQPSEPTEPKFDGFVTTRSGAEPEITEVVLDPRGEAALLLSVDGRVELRDSLDSAARGWSLPLQDPIWMSLAGKRDGGRFTVAVVDTANGVQVVELIPSAEPDEAHVEPRFVIPPEDPTLELHVLDGGERVLVLGVDHRLRLYDIDGALLSELDERGLAPWQLRVSGGDGREPLHLAVLLAGPVRIQRVELVDDQLRLLGEAHELELDRGPNRNDLALSADGRFAAALRRHKANRPEWSVELVDLETGERELIAGRLDTPVRARMHLLAGATLLLESGSGRGYMVDLEQAKPLRRRADADPDGRFALELARSTEHPWIDLPHEAELVHRWSPENIKARVEEVEVALDEADPGLRMHASVVGRTRVGITAKRTLEVLTLPDRPP